MRVKVKMKFCQNTKKYIYIFVAYAASYLPASALQYKSL